MRQRIGEGLDQDIKINGHFGHHSPVDVDVDFELTATADEVAATPVSTTTAASPVEDMVGTPRPFNNVKDVEQHGQYHHYHYPHMAPHHHHQHEHQHYQHYEHRPRVPSYHETPQFPAPTVANVGFFSGQLLPSTDVNGHSLGYGNGIGGGIGNGIDGVNGVSPVNGTNGNRSNRNGRNSRSRSHSPPTSNGLEITATQPQQDNPRRGNGRGRSINPNNGVITQEKVAMLMDRIFDTGYATLDKRKLANEVELDIKQIYNLLARNRRGNLRDKAITAATNGWASAASMLGMQEQQEAALAAAREAEQP